MAKFQMPNHTQMPNILVDEYMKHLNGSELKILLAICRKTIGWHKITDNISLSQLEEMTGLTRPTVTSNIHSLEEKNLIIANREKNTNCYELNMDSKNSLLVKKFNYPSKNILLSEGSNSKKIKPTKESIKETYTKETSERKVKLMKIPIRTYLKYADLEQVNDKRILLCCHIWNDLNEAFPDHKTIQKAKLFSWWDHVRLAQEQDGRTIEELWKMWRKAHKDSFWRKNILSTEKLRDQYDQLAIKLGEGKSRSNDRGRTDQIVKDLFADQG